MARDIFVYFDSEPDSSAVRDLLTDYLNGAGSIELSATMPGMFIANLPGQCSGKTFDDSDRYFEVFVRDDAMGITTRLSDRFTNAVAEGFAKHARLVWNGKTEEQRFKKEEH